MGLRERMTAAREKLRRLLPERKGVTKEKIENYVRAAMKEEEEKTGERKGLTIDARMKTIEINVLQFFDAITKPVEAKVELMIHGDALNAARLTREQREIVSRNLAHDLLTRWLEKKLENQEDITKGQLRKALETHEKNKGIMPATFSHKTLNEKVIRRLKELTSSNEKESDSMNHLLKDEDVALMSAAAEAASIAAAGEKKIRKIQDEVRKGRKLMYKVLYG